MALAKWISMRMLPIATIFSLTVGCGESSEKPCPSMSDIRCRGECTDVSTDRENCGFCGNVCSAGQNCLAGDCANCSNECNQDQRRCAQGSQNQFQICGDPDSDSCLEWQSSQTCPANQICKNGDCVPACSNKCDTELQQVCDPAAQNGFVICGKNDQGCLVWGSVNMCGLGTICQQGSCVPNCTDECTEQDKTKCDEPPHNGFVICSDHDNDTCLEWGGLTLCPGGETCSNGDCSSDCSDECQVDARQCDGAGYRKCGQYDSDPCLDWSSVIDCPQNQVCDTNTKQCVPSCSNECELDLKQCSADGVELCKDWDADLCTEWGLLQQCPQGYKCENNGCVEDCQDACTPQGKRMCDQSGYRICGIYQHVTCLDWSDIIPCDEGESCSDGVCSLTCNDECSTNDRECYTDTQGVGVRLCGQNDADSCLEWLPIQTYCLSWEICNPDSATCVSNCQDECTEQAAMMCSGTGYVVCGNWDPDPCLEWSATPQSCGDGKKCDAVTNTCVFDCTSICQSATRQCASGQNGYEICGDFNADTCLEWGSYTGCDVGTTCSNGECAIDCSDECSTLNQIVCDSVANGFKICGNYDQDTCLELSSLTQCDYNEVCDTADGCKVICTEDCTPGERRCVSGSAETCGQHDQDPCLDWSAPQACLGGTPLCFNGRCIPASPPTKVMVNEVLYDDGNNGGKYMYIELWGQAGQSLDNYWLVAIDGAGSGSPYLTIPLDNYILSADGHFLIANSNADDSFKADVDLFANINVLQMGPDNIQVWWGGSVVVDALGYKGWDAQGQQEIPFGTNDTWGGEPANDRTRAASAAAYDQASGIFYCLSRGADHADTNDNAADFFLRTTCTPGWEGPGKILWQEMVYGGTSTPAIDSAGNIYTVDSYGWITKVDASGVMVYNRVPPTGIKFSTSVAISADEQRLYAGSNNGLYALNASDGNPVAGWGPTAAGHPVYSSPAVGVDGVIYFGTGGDADADGYGVVAANPDGSQKWLFSTTKPIKSSPAVGNIGPSNETYIVVGLGGPGTGQLVALKASDGTQAWSYPTGAACNSSPAIDQDKTVYAGCDDGVLYAINGSTGSYVFAVSVGGSGATKLVEGCSPVVAPLQNGGTQIIMTSRSDTANFFIMYWQGGQLNGYTGNLFAGNSSAAISADGSFQLHSGTYLFDYDPLLNLEWYAVLNDTATAWISSSPAINANGVVYVVENHGPSSGGYLYAIQGMTPLYNGAGSYPKFRGDLPNSGRGY